MRRLFSGVFFFFVLGVLLLPSAAQAQVRVGISITTPPPALPVYEQPYCPGPNYIWTPGYWAWGDEGYYWVPGTWVVAPSVGLLWTPGYWGWGEGVYAWHAGYWGPHVGFYGGIDYGFGYGGVGYDGGYWRSGAFFYNTEVNRVHTSIIHNTYRRNVVVRSNTRVSYNGGRGGINARATAREDAAARERRFGATSVQTHHESTARSDRRQWASENHGRPPVAASPRAGEFRSGDAHVRNTAARGSDETHRQPSRQPTAAETRTRTNETNATRATHDTRATHHATTSGAERTPAHNTTRNTSTPHNAVRTETHENRGATPHNTSSTHNVTSNHNTSSTHAAAPRTSTRSNETHATHPTTHPSGHAESHAQPAHSPAPKENTRQEHSTPHATAPREDTSQAHAASHARSEPAAPRSAGSGSHGNASAGHGNAGHGNEAHDKQK